MIISGMVGSGKTVILGQVIKQCINQNKRAIIFDNKGDFTSKFLIENGAKHVKLFAPWDSRSIQFNVAKDLHSRLDAENFINMLIPKKDGDEMWSNSAKAIFLAMMIKLIAEKPLKWTFADLVDCLTMSNKELLNMMKKYNPIQQDLVSTDESNVTTKGIMINLKAFVQNMIYLAKAWPDSDAENNFSFLDWLYEKNHNDVKVIIFQGSNRFNTLSSELFASILKMLESHISSAGYGDLKYSDLFFILDEFPQLCATNKLDIFNLVYVGRSKRIKTIFGLQSLEQLKDIFSESTLNALTATIPNKIFTKVGKGQDSKTISEMLGKKDIYFKSNSISSSKDGGSNSIQGSESQKDVVSEDDIQKLGTYVSDLHVSKIKFFEKFLHFKINKLNRIVYSDKESKIYEKLCYVDGLKVSFNNDLLYYDIDEKRMKRLKKEFSKVEKEHKEYIEMLRRNFNFFVTTYERYKKENREDSGVKALFTCFDNPCIIKWKFKYSNFKRITEEVIEAEWVGKLIDIDNVEVVISQIKKEEEDLSNFMKEEEIASSIDIDDIAINTEMIYDINDVFSAIDDSEVSEVMCVDKNINDKLIQITDVFNNDSTYTLAQKERLQSSINSFSKIIRLKSI